jgi:hypothetical protein
MSLSKSPSPEGEVLNWRPSVGQLDIATMVTVPITMGTAFSLRSHHPAAAVAVAVLGGLVLQPIWVMWRREIERR